MTVQFTASETIYFSADAYTDTGGRVPAVGDLGAAFGNAKVLILEDN